MTTYRTMTAASTDIDSDDDMESSPFELESTDSIDHMELLFTRHKEILYSDWLEHKIPWENAWTPVWCVLKRNGTVFFTCSLKTHIGTLKLSSGSRFQNGPGNQKEGFRFDLNIHNKKHKFRVKTSHDRELWRAYMVGVITGTVPQDGTLTPQDMQVLLSKFQQHGALYPSPASHSSTPTIPSPAPSVNTPPSADNRPSASVSTKAAIEDSDLQLESSTVRHRSATGTISSRISVFHPWFSVLQHHKFDLYGNTNPPSWFFENCNRELAEKILKECWAMGNTLMRVSTSAISTASYIISKRLDSAEEILHYEVIRVAEGYKFITEDVTNTMETLGEVMDVFIQLSGPYTTRPMKTHDLKELGVEYDAYSRDLAPPMTELDLQLESSPVRHGSATDTTSSRNSEYESLRVRSRDNRFLEWPSKGFRHLGASIIGWGENRLSLGGSSDSDSGVSDISWRPFMHHKFDLKGNTNPPSWFFENCNRELAEKILKECRAMGNTLMRVSTAARPSGSYVISKRLDSAEEILHYEVIRVAEGYKINAENVTNTMETLDEVMDFFIQLSGPFTTRPMKTHDLKELGMEYDAHSRDMLEPGDLKPRISDRLPVPRVPDRTRALPGADALTERFIRPDLHCLYARRLPYRTMGKEKTDEIPPALRHPTHRTPGIGQRHQLNTHTEEMEGNSVSQQHEQTHPAWDSSNKTEQSIDQHSAVESGDAIYKDLASNVDLGSSDTTCVEDVKNAHETEVQEAADLETSSEMQTVISGVESDDPFIIWCDDGDESCKSQCSYCSTIDSTSSASSHTDFEQSDYSDENSDEKVSTGDMCHTLDQYRSPIFVEEWQASIVFDREGGCLKQNNSDVVLRVPPEAVEGNSVEVHAAVCANVDHVRDVLKLPDDAEVISPVAEYWAGEDFRFLRPVTVELPHILPSDYDQESVRVYHVSRNQEGNVCMSRLEHEKGDMHDTSGGEIFTHGQFLDVHQDKVAPSPVNDETVFNMESEAGTSTGEENSPDLTERLGGFRISPEGIVTVSTYGFCGYVCVYCNAKETKKRPELYVMGCVSDSSERWMEISVFVWDARLKISDFRKEYRVEPGDNRQRLILLDNLSNSKLHMRLLLSNSSGFSHCLAQHGGPLLPESKEYDIPSLLSCKRCIKRGRFFPISNKWILEPRNGYVQSPDHVFVVDVTHVAANVPPSWQDVDQKEKLNSLVVKMPDRLRMNDEDGWTNQLQVLSTAELETIARKLNISEPSRTESYRDQLLQRLAHGGPVRALLHVISQVSPSQGNHVSDASSLHPEGYPVSPDRPQSSARTINTNGASADEAGPDSETQRKCIRCSGSHDTGYGIQETYGLPGPVSQESSLSSMVTSDITEPKKAFSYRRENDARDEAQRILDRGPLLSRTSFSSFLQNADAMSENCGSPHQLNNMGSIPSSDFKRETQARLWQQQADGQTNGRLLRNHKETIDGGDGMEDYFRELEK